MAFRGGAGHSAPGTGADESILYGERGREENIRYFEALKSCCEMFVQSLAAVPKHIANYSSYLEDREKALYWQMTVEYGLRNMKMHIEWAQSCIDRLRAGGKEG